MTVKELFDFITDPTILEDNMDEYLDAVAERVTLREHGEVDPHTEVEDQVFKQAYIPQRLNEVCNVKKVERSLLLLYIFRIRPVDY